MSFLPPNLNLAWQRSKHGTEMGHHFVSFGAHDHYPDIGAGGTDFTHSGPSVIPQFSGGVVAAANGKPFMVKIETWNWNGAPFSVVWGTLPLSKHRRMQLKWGTIFGSFGAQTCHTDTNAK